jgi:hypothetical protein
MSNDKPAGEAPASPDTVAQGAAATADGKANPRAISAGPPMGPDGPDDDPDLTPHERAVIEQLRKNGDIVRARGENTPGPDIIRNGQYWDVKQITGTGNRTIQDALRSAKKNFSHEDATRLGLQRSDTRGILDVRGNAKWDSAAKIESEISRLHRSGNLGNLQEFEIWTTDKIFRWVKPK